MNKINKVIEECNKELRDKLFDLEGMCGDGIGGNEIDELESFISQRDQKILSAIEEEVERKRKSILTPPVGKVVGSMAINYEYNSAISDIKKLLKSTKKIK